MNRNPRRIAVPPLLALALALACLVGDGCSIRKLAVNKVGDALAGGGNTFSGDDDPDLVRQAVPFSLKLMESLLAESPSHSGLLRALASGFTQYAYAFVQQDADELEPKDFAGAEALRLRARRLYLRARDYGLRGLEVAHPGFTNRLLHSPVPAAATLKATDVATVYWTAAAWGAAISLSKDDPARIAEIPQVEALVERAMALDEAWGDGSLHTLMINLEMSRQAPQGEPATRARQHFERALELAEGRLAAPYVTYAEAVCLERQDAKQFEELLHLALAVNVDAHPQFRLVNLILQKRARWLLSRQEDLFLNPAPER